MKNTKFETITDAYQLVEGARIRATQNPGEIFILGKYDTGRKGYMAYPLDHGISYQDFGVLITEGELMLDYEIAKFNTISVMEKQMA
jgi:hypothetical protein